MRSYLMAVMLLGIPALVYGDVPPEESAAPADSTGESLVDSIIADAVSYLGTPYVYGGTDATGFDCSGLSYRVFADHGIDLPRTVSGLESYGEPVEREELLPGDILIFHNPSHVGLYIGEGDFVHCSSYLDRGVVITPISHSNYARRYHSARRVPGLH